ncbi:MAG: hypothetical protein QGH33_11515, partial [Pirellulaceae bacterium]|nr:hypothetical protein [Pirellulaceae bacterium]
RQAVITMRFFLAGIMQGSRQDAGLHQQDYRARLAKLITTHLPEADVYDPLAGHPESVAYSDDDGRRVFYGHNRLCREVDVVIAFLPEASMGTAIEMWEAHEHGRAAVLTISPLDHNWAVRFCSHAIYPDLESFENAVLSGKVLQTVKRVLASRQA